MLLWRKLNLPVPPSTNLVEEHIVHQIKKCVGGLADKVKIILKEVIKMTNVVKEYIMV